MKKTKPQPHPRLPNALRKMTRDEIYRRVSSRKGNGVTIRRSLCFYSPAEVLAGVTRHREVTRWLSYIGNHYVPPIKDILLIYPCSAGKPYNRSRSYMRVYETLSRLGLDRRKIHVATISEPFGLVPEELYDTKTLWHNWEDDWYDCPGLFEWWCRKHGTRYS
jgi:archaeosine synthase